MMLSSSTRWITFALFALTLIAVRPETADAKPRPPHVAKRAASASEERIIVKFKDGQNESKRAGVLKRAAARLAKRFARLGIDVLAVDRTRGVARTIEELVASGTVEYAEPDFVVELAATQPNDPLLPEMWALENRGQTFGVVDADIDAPEAWDTSTGDPSVVVAVIDTGVDYTHEDLAANMWMNPGEVRDGVDNDGNGYVDDIHGINAISGSGDPFDDAGHGTHVAGTIAAVADNGIGIAGVAPNVRIMALKFITPENEGFVSDAIECIEYASVMKTVYGVNVRLSSNSWRWTWFNGGSEALYDAIVHSEQAGILFVAAAGNERHSNDFGWIAYPASYDLDSIVGVACSEESDRLCDFSNHGVRSVDLAAPGRDILSTLPGNQYAKWSGTSMATPHVAGVAALLASIDPDGDALGLKSLLLNTVDRLDSLAGRVASGGRLNAANALETCQTGALHLVSNLVDGFQLGLGETASLEVTVLDCTRRVLNASLTLDFDDGTAQRFLRDDGLAPDRKPSDGIYTTTWMATLPGPASLLISASSPEGTGVRALHGRVGANTRYATASAGFEWSDPALDELVAYPDASDVTAIVQLDFDFPFYGLAYDHLQVARSGYVTLGGPPRQPDAPAFELSPQPLIAPYWHDSAYDTETQIRVNRGGAAPRRFLTLKWVDPTTEGEGVPRATFALTLREGGDIEFAYLDLSSGTTCDFGGCARIGIQDQGGQHPHLSSEGAIPLQESSATLVCADDDGDGACDSEDNCLARANPEQTDTDADGFGNVCDGDFDNDGLTLPSDFEIFDRDFSETGIDSGVGTDMDGDGLVLPNDFELWQAQFESGGLPGPSAPACTSAPGC
jgi:subtilisin family serine protease